MADFDCWIPCLGQSKGDGLPVKAVDAESAAVKFVEDYERRQAEYPVAAGGSIIVIVDSAGETSEVTVWGEARPTYYARVLKNDP